MIYDTILNINKIIERDSKTTTYKFALIRGVIDIIDEASPFIEVNDDIVNIPTGLMIEKWIIYYFNLLASETKIPQINGNNNLAFEIYFSDIIGYYQNNGGISVLFHDIQKNSIPENLINSFTKLSKKIYDTIIRMPMKYIGRSISNDYYSIFQYQKYKNKKIAYEGFGICYLINTFGTFSIPINYYDAFKIFGRFLSGRNSLFTKWAEFSISASDNQLNFSDVFANIIKEPITERNVQATKKLLSTILMEKQNIQCVWTEKRIKKFDIDHIIPFSIWKNNDLWNLLPSQPKVNNQKRDKIPTSELIELKKDIIFSYWDYFDERYSDRFRSEISISLIGSELKDNWKNVALEKLKNISNNLINNLGYTPWQN